MRVRERLRKATFNLPDVLLVSLDEAVRGGAAASKNALVERALERELELLRRAARGAQWEAASRDPLFLQDLKELETAFESADPESLRDVR